MTDLTGYDIDRLLTRVDDCAGRIPEYRRDGIQDTRLVLEQIPERARRASAAPPLRQVLASRAAALVRS